MGVETHPYYEILYYMKGDAVFLSEQFEEKLSEGTLLIIPKGYYHKFKIENQENYTRLVLNFTDIEEFRELFSGVLSGIKIIKYPNSAIVNSVNKICRILEDQKNERSLNLLLYATFHMLIAEINANPAKTQTPHKREDDMLIVKCIDYINRNFTRDITVKSLANEMNVSESSLFLCFKKHLGISVYKYITEKRLIHANQLIAQNERPTKIYSACGFNDYPTFYKAYKKMFGESPSQHNAKTDSL